MNQESSIYKSFIDIERKHVDFYSVTPEFAEYLISLNIKNRAIQASQVDKITDDMKGGKWEVTHQGIAIAKTGRLLDGQKRLHSIVNSGITVEMQITTGLDESAFEVIDIGQKRSLADRISLHPTRSSIVAMAMKISSFKPDDTKVAHRMNEAISYQMEELFAYCNSAARRTSHTAVRLAAICRMISAKDADDISYIKTTYRDINLRNYESFSKIMSSFVAQISDKNSVSPYRLFAMAMYLFDSKNKDKRLVYVSQTHEADFIEMGRDILKKSLKA